MTETTWNKQLMTAWLTPTWTCGEGTNGVHRRFSGFICTKAFCFVWQQDKWSSSNLCFSIITHLNTNDIHHTLINHYITNNSKCSSTNNAQLNTGSTYIAAVAPAVKDNMQLSAYHRASFTCISGVFGQHTMLQCSVLFLNLKFQKCSVMHGFGCC